MYHKIGTQTLGGVVIHAAGAIRNISHHNHFCMREMTNNIGNSACITTNEAWGIRLHSQTLRKLKTNRFCMCLCDSVDRFVYFEIVVGREAIDCLVQGLVM